MAPEKKKENWKVLLEAGTRHSTGNTGKDTHKYAGDPGRVLFLLDEQFDQRHEAMAERVKNMKAKHPKTYRERLKGLFGGEKK